ncbi:serine hydrolase domain-containing protein [Brevibacillus sp. FSL L8-0520]|uniref:serine hydrolase domain-containing protein n=1 Tax=Brevibacillus sp. FSL L8-0520 TaxID=2954689 RepID=UPI0030CEE45E
MKSLLSVQSFRFYSYFLCLSLIVSTLILPSQHASAAQQAISAELQAKLDEIDAYIDDAAAKLGAPGGSMVLVKDGQIVYRKTWGVTGDGKTAVTAQTPFLLGSLSKGLTAYGIMLLVQANKIDLDAPVRQYLPSFTLESEEDAAKITVRQLLTQTSGLGTESGMKFADQGADDSEAVQRYVRELSTEATTARPGERHQYSNANYGILGALIERIYGVSFEEYMDKSVFEPLGMSNAAASVRQAKEKGWMSGYRSWFGLSVQSDIAYDNGGAPYGYIAASAEDMGHYLIGMLQPDAVLSARYTRMMMEPAVLTRANSQTSYGFGWRITPLAEGGERIWHAGSTPDYRSEIMLLPGEGWGAAILTNRNNSLEEIRLTQVMNGVQQILLGKKAQPVTFSVPMERWLFAVVFLVLLLVTAMVVYRLFRVRRKSGNRRIWAGLATVFILLAVLLLPVLLYGLNVTWHTFSLFVPDMAALAVGCVVLLTASGLLSVKMAVNG